LPTHYVPSSEAGARPELTLASFSLYARVATGNFGANARRFEKLHRRAGKSAQT
jgi:hypothetical protein